MADAGAEVHQRLAFSLSIPAAYRAHADLEFQSGGASILSLDAVVLVSLSVLMKVDEPGRYDVAARVNLSFAP
jgi:hypothetical protein